MQPPSKDRTMVGRISPVIAPEEKSTPYLTERFSQYSGDLATRARVESQLNRSANSLDLLDAHPVLPEPAPQQRSRNSSLTTEDSYMMREKVTAAAASQSIKGEPRRYGGGGWDDHERDRESRGGVNDYVSSLLVGGSAGEDYLGGSSGRKYNLDGEKNGGGIGSKALEESLVSDIVDDDSFTTRQLAREKDYDDDDIQTKPNTESYKRSTEAGLSHHDAAEIDRILAKHLGRAFGTSSAGTGTGESALKLDSSRIGDAPIRSSRESSDSETVKVSNGVTNGIEERGGEGDIKRPTSKQENAIDDLYVSGSSSQTPTKDPSGDEPYVSKFQEEAKRSSSSMSSHSNLLKSGSHSSHISLNESERTGEQHGNDIDGQTNEEAKTPKLGDCAWESERYADSYWDSKELASSHTSQVRVFESIYVECI